MVELIRTSGSLPSCSPLSFAPGGTALLLPPIFRKQCSVSLSLPAIRSVRMIQSLTSCMRLHYLTLYFSSSFSQFMSRTSEAKPEMMMIKSVSSQPVPTGHSNLLCAIWENMNLNWRFVTSARVCAPRLCARTRPSSFGMTKYKRSLF